MAITTFDHVNNYSISIACIICGEAVPLSEEEAMSLRHGHHIHSKVCDKCKQAVLYLRKEMDK